MHVHIFIGSLVDLPVSLSAVEPSLAASTPPPYCTTVRSTRSLLHQCQLCTALCGCSRSDADSATGSWDSLLSPRPGSPFLCASDLFHSTSLPAWKFCAGQDSEPGGRWAGHEPQDFYILSSAAGRTSEWPCIQLLHLLCDPVRSSDWRSLYRAGVRLYCKD